MNLSVPLASSQRASVTGMLTLVILTWMRGWHQAIAVAASATTVSTTQKDSTVSAASRASTGTSGSHSLPRTPANVSQQPFTSKVLLKWEGDKGKTFLPLPREICLLLCMTGSSLNSLFDAVHKKQWCGFAGWKPADTVDKSIPRIPVALGQGKRDYSFTFSCYFWRAKAASCLYVLLIWWLLQPQKQGASANRGAGDK